MKTLMFIFAVQNAFIRHQSINQSIVLFPEQDAHMDCIEVYICISVRLHVSLHMERYISLVELHVDFVCTFR
jgi:hypothetical protein